MGFESPLPTNQVKQVKMRTQAMKTAKGTTTNVVKVESMKGLTLKEKVAKYEALKTQGTLTLTQLGYLANAKYKIEDRSLSKVYKVVSELSDAKELLGNSPMPTFKQFAEAMPIKDFYSVYEGIRTLIKFNKASATATKVARQNKATAKK
jgi:hypothetical protein